MRARDSQASLEAGNLTPTRAPRPIPGPLSGLQGLKMAKENSGSRLQIHIWPLCPLVPTLPFPSLKWDKNSTCHIQATVENLMLLEALRANPGHGG